MNAFEALLDRIVKLETKAGNISTGRVIYLHEQFVELEHRNGARSLVSYDSIASMAEIPEGVRA